MSTFTASLHTSGVKKNHAGPNVVSSVATITTTGTAGSTVLLAKVPNGAVITDFLWYVKDGGADQTWKLGLQLPEGLSGSWTTTTSILLTNTSNTGASGVTVAGSAKLPVKVSFTDTERFAWVIGVATAAISASADSRFKVEYVMDQDNI